MIVGVRLSVFDFVPYQTSREIGQPMELRLVCCRTSTASASTANDPLQIDLTEPIELLRMLVAHGVAAVNLSCGSPYYNPHIQRPAIFPPSDGYQPPEDPLVGVARQIDTVRECKLHERSRRARISAARRHRLHATCRTTCRTSPRPSSARAGSTSSASAAWCSRIPNCRPTRSPASRMQRKNVCRTFSDCTTAPRNGLISGCYPLDPYYKATAGARRADRNQTALGDLRPQNRRLWYCFSCFSGFGTPPALSLCGEGDKFSY